MRYVSNRIVKLYKNSSIWTRSLASTIYGALKNRKENSKFFWQCFAELEESQWWPLEKLEELQCERLKKIIAFSATSIPYYKKLFTDYGISPSQIQTPDDLKKLPTLSKETVRKETRNLITNNIDMRHLRLESTGGTTGTPLTVWMDDKTYAFHKAVQWLQHRWARYTHKEWIGVLAGYKIIPLSRNKPPFWITNYAGKQIHFSSYHLNLAYLPFYVKKLFTSRIKYLLGYASAVGLLAQYINSISKKLSLKAVFLSSEPILLWQRKAIRKAFDCPIFDYYDQAERVISAINCNHSISLHINMEIGIVELEKIASTENRYNIIGTSLVNYAFPLIRYRLGDVSSKSVLGCKCGRKHPMIRPIETRVEDFIITSIGSIIPAPALTLAYHGISGILASQIIQEDIDLLRIKIIPNILFTKEEEERFKENFISCVGKEMRIEIQRVEDIPRTKNGKFRFVISKVPFELQSDG